MALLYVDVATGDDSRSKATAANPATPWATLGRAAWGSTDRSTPNSGEALAAGDTVIVAAGTYVNTSVVNNRFTPLYLPTNSGSSGSPISFVADGVVTLEAPNVLAPVLGGTSAVNYISWIGHFTIDQADHLAHADTGPVTFHTSTGCLINGMELIGTPAFSWGDNHNAVRMEAAVSCTVKNCTLTDWYDGSGANGSFFTLYGCQNCIVEHNRGDGAGTAVYFKDTGTMPPQLGNIVRFNYFTDTLNSFFRWSHVTAPADEDRNFVYQNLCIGGNRGINVIDATNDWVYNNTFVNCVESMSPSAVASGIRAWNNIFENSTTMVLVESAPMPAASVWSNEHNVYHTFTNFYEGSDGTRNFASYLAAFTDQDVAAPASITSDPLFVNAGGVDAVDYKLQVGSPAINLGRDPDTAAVVNAGCYITGNEIIGPEDPLADIVLVQSAEDLTTPWATDGTGVATFPAPTTVGNVIIVLWGISADLTFTVADNGAGGSNTYGTTTRSTFVNGAGVTQIAYAVVERAASVVTVTASAASVLVGYMKILEFSGLSITDLLEAQAQDTTGLATSHPTGPVTTILDKSLLVGVLQGTSGAYNGTPTGFTEVYDQASGVAAYKILSAPTTESWTPTSSEPGEFTSSSIAAFNAGPVTPPPTPGSVPVVVANLKNQGIL